MCYVQAPYASLNFALQERKRESIFMGSQKASRQKARVRRAEVPGAYQDRENYQESDSKVEMQRVQQRVDAKGDASKKGGDSAIAK